MAIEESGLVSGTKYNGKKYGMTDWLSLWACVTWSLDLSNHAKLTETDLCPAVILHYDS